MKRQRRAVVGLTAVAAMASLGLTACSGSLGSSGSSKSPGNPQASGSSGGRALTVWTEENDPQRMNEERKMFAGFTKQSGIKVNLVGIAENQFSTLITSAAAAGKLPDVIGALPVSDADQLAAEHIADTGAADAVVSKLGRSTFEAKALDLATLKGHLVGVPSDTWVQLLVYRKDLFQKYHLPTPSSYASIMADAKALKSHGYVGIVAGTDANDAFTEQTFEYIAMANGCQLVNNAGHITLGSPQCTGAFSFFNDLMKKNSVTGSQTVDSTEQEYLAGKAGMVVWSSYILPPLAGQQTGSVPSCTQCKGDPTYLAKNSGIVTSISGTPGSTPTDYGQLSAWVISKNSQAKPEAEKLVEYAMDQGYGSWLSLNPPGKLPVRIKTSQGSVNAAWSKLSISLGGSMPVSKFYGADTISNLLAGPKKITIWGIPQGQGALLGATLASQPVANAISAMISGGLSPKQAQAQAVSGVKGVQANMQ